MEKLLENMAKELVDQPEEVKVRMITGEVLTVFELRVADDDLGKVIGKQGRIADALRVIVAAVGMKSRRRYTLEILD